MQLTGKLKKQVEKANSREEKKSLIANAGMMLDDDELDQVSGGLSNESLLQQLSNNNPVIGDVNQESDLYACVTSPGGNSSDDGITVGENSGGFNTMDAKDSMADMVVTDTADPALSNGITVTDVGNSSMVDLFNIADRLINEANQSNSNPGADDVMQGLENFHQNTGGQSPVDSNDGGNILQMDLGDPDLMNPEDTQLVSPVNMIENSDTRRSYGMGGVVGLDVFDNE